MNISYLKAACLFKGDEQYIIIVYNNITDDRLNRFLIDACAFLKSYMLN